MKHKAWTRKAEKEFENLRIALGAVIYAAHELRDELRGRPSSEESQKLCAQAIETCNKFTNEHVWPFYEKYYPEGYAQAIRRRQQDE